MQCPVCKDKTLVVANRQGIEIDYCPQCRGVWLDRGELDKIIERSAEIEERRAASADPGGASVRTGTPSGDGGEPTSDRTFNVAFSSTPGKRQGLLSELLDFD